WSLPLTAYLTTQISAPAVADGKVYVQKGGSSGNSGNPSQFPRAVGIDASNGEQIFNTSYNNQFGSNNQPTLHSGNMIAHGGTFGGLYSWNGTTGSQQWFTGGQGSPGGLPFQNDTIVAANSTHIFTYFGEASASPGPAIGTFYALNRTTGTLAYTITNSLDGGNISGGLSAPLLGDNNDAFVLTRSTTRFGTTATDLVAFNLTNQTIRWRATLDSGSYTGNAAFHDDALYLPVNNGLRVVDQNTGALLWTWTAPNGEAIEWNAVVTDDLVFVSGILGTYAIDRVTRQTVWSTTDIGQLTLGHEKLIITNGARMSVYTVVPEPALVGSLVMLSIVGWRSRKRRTMSA
ncbi:MAG: PQQ-binding-like beta-propeller repeat protein, partial [Gemmataceae bacterium]